MGLTRIRRCGRQNARKPRSETPLRYLRRGSQASRWTWPRRLQALPAKLLSRLRANRAGARAEARDVRHMQRVPWDRDGAEQIVLKWAYRHGMDKCFGCRNGNWNGEHYYLERVMSNTIHRPKISWWCEAAAKHLDFLCERLEKTHGEEPGEDHLGVARDYAKALRGCAEVLASPAATAQGTGGFDGC